MSGPGFAYSKVDETRHVSFRVPRDSNSKMLLFFSKKNEDLAVLRREKTCLGAKLAKSDDMPVRDVWESFSSGTLKGQKTIQFPLTPKCQDVINDFRANHPYISSEEVAFQVLHEVGVMYGENV